MVAEALPLSRYLRTRGRGAASTHAYATHSPSLLGLAEELAEDDDVLRLDLDSFLGSGAERIEQTQPTRLRAVVVRLGSGGLGAGPRRADRLAGASRRRRSGRRWRTR